MKIHSYGHLCISTDKDDKKWRFRIWKHKGSSFFKKWSKVIEITINYKLIIIEF
jgi:hypothetical protein